MSASREGLSVSDYDLRNNFAEVIPPMKHKEAIDEAHRCLFCFDAPCVKACPTGIDIPSFIKKITTGNMYGSAKAIMEANPVGASCARVCPTSELCEGACVLNNASKPIMIGLLQRHATDWAIKNNIKLFEAGQSNGRKVAIVGGGSAGLSAARELARLGYAVTVYEAKEKAGGLNAYGIVSFRLPQEIAMWEVEQVESLGVDFRCGVQVGVDVSPGELLQSYDAVLLAAGLGPVPKLAVEGEDLDGVYDAISFIEETKTKELTQSLIGKRVAVIGAGNTAIDAATCCKRLGAKQVQILYRRTSQEMTAYEFEYEFAKQDGVEFRWLVSPTRILGKDGQVTGIELVRIELSELDEKGRRKPVAIPESEFIMEVDVVIKAIGQMKHLPLIEAFGLVHNNGVISVRQDTYQTSLDNVYAAGDCIFGGGKTEAMVVDAAKQGKEAAYAIHRSLVDKQPTG